MEIKKKGALLLVGCMSVCSLNVVTFAQDQIYHFETGKVLMSTTTTPAETTASKATISTSTSKEDGKTYLWIKVNGGKKVDSVKVGSSSATYDSSEKKYYYRVSSTGTYTITVTVNGVKTTKDVKVEVSDDAPSLTVSKKYKNSKWYLVIKASASVDIKKVTVDGDEIDFDEDGGTEEVYIKKTGDYEVVVTDVNGEKTKKTVYVNVDATETGKPELKLSKKYKDKKWYLVMETSDDGKIKKLIVDGKSITHKEKGGTVEYAVSKTATYKVELTDDEDNVTKASLYIDVTLDGSTPPTINLSKETKGGKYYLVIEAKDDSKIAKVTANGKEITFNASGETVSYEVTVSGNYVVRVTDEDGNEASKSLYIDVTAQQPVVQSNKKKHTAIFKQGSKNWSKNGVNQASMEVAPMNKHNRIYLPLRYVAYALNISEGSVSWDSSTKTATIVDGLLTVKVKLGSKQMEVNGKIVTMDVAPEMKEGRIMLPISQISKAFESKGVSINWDNNQKQAVVSVTE